MTSAFTRRTWGSSLLIAGMVIPAATVGGSAFAAPTCALSTPAATLITPGICEVTMTASGTFTPPVGVSKVAAVLVGGGGGGGLYSYLGGYGGGGGEVTYVDSVAVDQPLPVTIGSGGTSGEWIGPFVWAGNGSNTTAGTHVARGGGYGDMAGGISGNGNLGYWNEDDGNPALGGGAQSAAAPTSVGAGYLLSGIPTVDATLFPASANPAVKFGQGGGLSTAVPVIGSGIGGGFDAVEGFAGASGSVVFRFAATEAAAAPDDDELAATGANDIALVVGALGLGVMAAGAALITRPRRSTMG